MGDIESFLEFLFVKLLLELIELGDLGDLDFGHIRNPRAKTLEIVTREIVREIVYNFPLAFDPVTLLIVRRAEFYTFELKVGC